MGHSNSLLVSSRAHWTIRALIMSVWTQIQCFREKRSCIQIFILPTGHQTCPWTHSSCQFGINMPLGMSHHQPNTPWKRKLGWFLLWCAQIRRNHKGKKSCTTHPSLTLLQSSGSLMLSQEHTQHFDFGRHEPNNIRTLLQALQGCENDDTERPPSQSESDAKTSLLVGRVSHSIFFFFCNNLGKPICCSLKERVCDAAQNVSSFLVTRPGN